MITASSCSAGDVDPLISSHLLCHWLPTGCSATRADAANLCGARSPQAPEMRCSYPRMCARRSCAQSQQVVKCRGKLGALGIPRARRASLMGLRPCLHQTNQAKKHVFVQHSCLQPPIIVSHPGTQDPPSTTGTRSWCSAELQ